MTSINERQYQIPFCQLLSAEGESVVEISSHHPHEKGKDVVTTLPSGKVKAYQLKAGRIDLSAWHAIESEINNLVELPVEHPSIKSRAWHQPVLVTNGDITPPVLDQIRSKNESFKRRRLPILQLVVKGQLLKRFEALHGHFLPREPKDFSRLLKLILQGGAAPLDKNALAVLLRGVLSFGDERPSARNIGRSLASATLLTSYVIGGCAAEKNHWAVFEAWTMMAACSLALAEKTQTAERHWRPSFDLCVLGARRALGDLVDECRTRTHFVEGDALMDGHFFRYRMTILVGLLSAWALHAGQDGSNPDIDFAEGFVRRQLRESTPWGESAVPYYMLAALLLERSGKRRISEALVSNLISAIAAQNGSDVEARPGLPNPYYSADDAVRMSCGLDPYNMENFAGFSYALQPLIDYLARRWCKVELALLWHSITRISLQRFEPQHGWEFLTWRARSGKLISTFANEPQKWSSLVAGADDVSAAHLPQLLVRHLSFLPLFILVFPHRYDRGVQKLLEECCRSCETEPWQA